MAQKDPVPPQTIGNCIFCEQTTGGSHEHDCPYAPQSHRLLAPTGWVCPACGRGNAPWKGSCDCAGAAVGAPTVTYTNDVWAPGIDSGSLTAGDEGYKVTRITQ